MILINRGDSWLVEYWLTRAIPVAYTLARDYRRWWLDILTYNILTDNMGGARYFWDNVKENGPGDFH